LYCENNYQMYEVIVVFADVYGNLGIVGKLKGLQLTKVI